VKTFAALRQFRRNAWLFLASNFVGALGYTIFFLILNLYLARIGLGKEVISWVNAAVWLAGGLLCIPMSIVFERMQGAIAGLFVLFSAPIPLIVCAFFLGASYTIFLVLTSPFIMENSAPQERLHLFSWNYVLIWIASVLGNLLGGVLPGWLMVGESEISGFRWSLVVAAVLYCIAALPFLFLRSYRHPRGAGFRLRMALGSHAWKYMLAVFVSMIGAGLFVPFLNLFLDARGFSTQAIGLVFTLGSIASTLTTIGSPWLAARFGRIGALSLTQVMTLPFFFLLAFAQAPVWLGMAYVFRQALANLGGPLGDSFSMDLVPETSWANFAALQASVRSLSWAFTAPIAGWIMQGFGFTWLFLVAAILYLTSASLLWGFFRRKNQATTR
jgi:MFS family permease